MVIKPLLLWPWAYDPNTTKLFLKIFKKLLKFFNLSLRRLSFPYRDPFTRTHIRIEFAVNKFTNIHASPLSLDTSSNLSNQTY